HVEAPVTVIGVPGSWNANHAEGGRPGPDGYTTYRLKVLLPARRDRLMALEVGEVGTAYRLYVNGQHLGGKGNVGTSPDESRPSTVPHVYLFRPAAGEADIVMQVSNYHYRMGGIWYSIRLGDAEQVLGGRNLAMLAEAFFAGILLVMALYHIVIAAVFRRDPASLFFGLACLDIALRQLVIGNKLALLVFPALPWEAYLRAEYLTIGLAVPLFARYLKSIFPSEIHTGALTAFNILCGIFCTAVIALPSRLYTETIIPYEIVILGFIAYGVFTAVKSYRWGNSDALRVLLPGFLFGATAVNDILFANGIIHTVYLVPAGLFIFIFSQAYLLARRYAHAFDKAERLSAVLAGKNENLTTLNRELVALKQGLENKVIERTRDLEIERDRAEEASRAKSAFLAHMSHELRTPLNAVLGFSDLLLLGNAGIPEKDRESVRHIHDAGEHLLSMVNDVLDLSKIEAGKSTTDMKPVDIAQLLRDIPASMKSLADQKGLKLTAAIGEDAGTVLGDETKLRQIVINLMSNAIKFTPAGGEAGLDAAASGDWMKITVWDRGIGISKDNLERIFEPFEQVTTKENGKPRGTGLGLSIARRLAELHGGTLTAESEPGRGSRFTLALPLATGRVPAARIARESPSMPGAMQVLAGSILVVEDNEIIVKLMRSMLKNTPVPAAFASRGAEAVRLATGGGPFDLILMDIQLPGMDGITALAGIRSALGDAIPPVIAMTAHAMEGDRDRFIAQGFSDYLPKPFRMDDLLAKMREHLG
nr:response regulator [Spirochaetota bacterium]